jgi:soluble P-type ATPase
MLVIEIPGFSRLKLHHLVLDYNGTIAVNGSLLPGIDSRLQVLAGSLQIHVLTADTFGGVARNLEGLPCSLHVLAPGRQDAAKLVYVEKLGWEMTVSIGNGRNDAAMLRRSALGIAVLQQEGAASAAMLAADLVAHAIADALDLLLNPLRLTATLRN